MNIPRVVLDTNVWLDWLVFDDHSMYYLQSELNAGKIEIIINEACKDEFVRVLYYPRLGLSEEEIFEKRHRMDMNCSIRIGPSSNPNASIPVCRDPDDQKFLQLACESGASWLLSRDKALLALNKKVKHRSLMILTPDCWRVKCSNQSNSQHL